MFFVFDGVDGAGKSTQLNLFSQWLTDSGRDVVTCKDPGTTKLGEKMRSILLGDHQTPIDMRSEMMMFMAARAQLVAEVIRPALEAGKTVVCDRYVFSTVVYQGHAGDLDPNEIWKVNHAATGGLMADLTFILDLDVDISLDRVGDSRDRMESRGRPYFEKVRNGFLEEAKRWPQGVEVVSATGTPEKIQTEIRKLAEKHMALIQGDAS